MKANTSRLRAVRHAAQTSFTQMKHFTFAALVTLLLAGTNVTAQKDSTSTFHVGFIYPLSTNGKAAGEISNRFSFHFLSGYSKNETGFALAGLANIIRNNAEGVQVAGLINQVGGKASGAQIAGIGNYVRDTTRGIQVAGVYNLSGAVDNQVAGVFNHSKGNVRGVQVAGVGNRAVDVNSQIGGFINIARHVSGVQLSGFLNIAESSDYSIGVINLIKNGEKGLGAQLDETMTTTIVFRSGGRKLYSIIGVGYNKRPGGDQYLAMEGGLGANWKFGPMFRLKSEAVSRSLMKSFDDDGVQMVTLRLLPALKVADKLEFFAGPSFSFTYYDKEDDDFNFPFTPIWTREKGDRFNGLNFGWTAGLQVHF